MTRISQIPEDIYVIAASYGPSPKERVIHHTERGVAVQTLRIHKIEKGRHYRECVFPDGRVMWVNEGNIRSHRVPDTGVLS
jgi:hypothetical protein